MSQHSPEPWKLVEVPHNLGSLTAHDANDKPLESDPYDGVGSADWRRIVLCVNFCRGLTDEELRQEPPA